MAGEDPGAGLSLPSGWSDCETRQKMPGVQNGRSQLGAVQALAFLHRRRVAGLRGREGVGGRQGQRRTPLKGAGGGTEVCAGHWLWASSPPPSFVREQFPLVSCGARTPSQIHLHMKSQGPVEGTQGAETG